MNGLVGVHMLIGLALIPPVGLKLASTGYRFARYYAGSRAYRAKGPPHIWLRALAPVLVIATVAMFTSGVVLLADGHKAGTLLEVHKVSFIVWGAVFGVHFLAYAPGVARSLPGYWRAAERPRGAGLRGTLIALAAGAGVALAAAVYPAVTSWQP